MPRRILLLITDLQIGGTPTVVRELAVRLHDDDGAAEVEVACLSKWGPVADQLRDAGIEVTALGARGPADLRVLRGLVDLINRRKFDTVVSFLIHANTMAAVASWFCGDVTFIQSIQTTQPRPRWHWTVQRVVQHCVESIVVPTESAARVAREWADVPEQKIVVIPNAVDFSRISAARGTRGNDRAADVRIGFLGRLDPVKRVSDLVRAAALLEGRYSLDLFGDGEDRAAVESEVDQLGLRHRVRLHGSVAAPQAALDRIDVLVLPSEAEGFGLVLIEAMAAGVPVVATDVAGIRDVVRDGVTGLLVPVARPDLLAEAVRRVTETPGLRARLVEAARDDVRRRFDWSVVLPRYRALLKLERS